jgi:PIN domain nuclease of toxin-antitoxin system
MSRYVFDACALLAYLQGEDRALGARRLVLQAKEGAVELHLSAMNLLEVQYVLIRRGKTIPQLDGAIRALPIQIASADAYLEQVAGLKAMHSVSLGGCFCAALARDLQCPVVTFDPEFRKLESIVQVEWLG